MPDIEDLQKIKADLEAQIAQAMEQEAARKKQEEVERVKARQAEIANGLKEISVLMRQYRLSKEHLFKAAKSATPIQVASAEGGATGREFNPNDIRDDLGFGFERPAASNEPARPMSVEDMRQFYGQLDAMKPKSA
jgi:hypothetical protein